MNIKVRIEGKNVNNYLKWLIKNKIDLININIISYNVLEIIINYKDYHRLNTYSKTYKIKIIKTYGRIKLLGILKNNVVVLSAIVVSIVLLFFMSHLILSIDIIYNDKDIVDKISKELNKYNIKKYHIKKSYDYLNKVKKNILKDNKDILEWIEIEESGTKYTVRLVERKKAVKEKEYTYQSLMSKKDATIVSITAYSGEKVKEVGEYIKKGTTIVSGIMTKPDGTSIYTKAKGIITGEVWYKVTAEYPIYYSEERLTGKRKRVLTLYILNKEIPIFPYKKYKQFKKETIPIIEDNLIPIKITKENIYEVIIDGYIYTEEEAIAKAIKEVENKLQAKNSNIIEINKVLVLDKELLNSKVKLELFISTIEDITEIKEEIIEN